MFTGLIEDIGTVTDTRSRGNYRVLTITSKIADPSLRIGDSVNCDGACLTVIELAPGSFTIEASQETASRTILNGYKRGSRLNLERALQIGSRLGGHFVMGHIDTTGAIDYIRPIGESLEIAVQFDRQFDPLVIEKGSIAINGISLTVNSVRSGWFSVNLIPHSVAHTTVNDFQAGERVNLEFDMIGKYIIRMQQSTGNNAITLDMLKKSGW